MLQWQGVHAVRNRMRGSTSPLIVPVDMCQFQIPREHLLTIGETKRRTEHRPFTVLILRLGG